jgi:hypothetical protein
MIMIIKEQEYCDKEKRKEEGETTIKERII